MVHKCFNSLLSDLCLPGSLYFIITITIPCDIWNRIHNFMWGYITCTCYHRNKGEVCTLISNTEVCSSSIYDQKSFLALPYHDDVVSNNASSQNWTTGMNFMFVLVSLMPRTPPRSRKEKGSVVTSLNLIAVVLKPCKWKITNLSAGIMNFVTSLWAVPLFLHLH